MTVTYTATLGSLIFDCATPDSDGIVWSFESIDGWHDSADVDQSLLDVMYGQTVTGAHEKARALIIRGGAYLPGTPPRPLEAKWWLAERRLKRETRFVYVPGLLTVIEPALSLQAYVLRPRKIAVKRIGAGPYNLGFEIPLLAPDPRRYDASLTTNTDLELTGSGTTDSATIINAGDQPTAPTVTIDGPATNPKVTNADDDGRYVEYVGTLGAGDTLVLDMAAQTATIASVSVIGSISAASQFWSLLPGNNGVTYARTAGSGTSAALVAYRHAYS